MVAELRAGVIGLGMGKRHAQAYREIKGSSLVAVCDADDEKVRQVTTEVGAEVGTTELARVQLTSFNYR